MKKISIYLYPFIVFLLSISISFILPSLNEEYFSLVLALSIALALLSIILFVLSAIDIMKNLKEKEGHDFLKISVKVKFFHMLPHALMFLWGAIMASFLFTIYITIIMFFLSCSIMLLSGSHASGALIRNRENFSSKAILTLLIMSQFCFIIDVVVILVTYAKMKRKKTLGN